MKLIKRDGDKVQVECTGEELVMLSVGYGMAGKAGVLRMFGEKGAQLAEDLRHVVEEGFPVEVKEGMARMGQPKAQSHWKA